ncbi:MAG: thioredoxin family protein [Myxococcales bacterium]|nr:thioredoxin family protein [Myxococcales bacterium]
MALRRPLLVLALLGAFGCRGRWPSWRSADAGDPGAANVRADLSGDWPLRTEAELQRAIDDALARARRQRKAVLLEFVAGWCSDCQQMVRIEMLSPAREVLAQRYERVTINVGNFDRHLTLLRTYGIDRIAAYVVLDAQSGMRVAQTTMEPVTQHREITPERWAAWLQNPR